MRETLATISSIDPEVTKWACRRFAKCLKDADAAVRSNAIHTLGRMGKSAGDATAALAIVVTSDKEAAVRKEAAMTLAAIGLGAADAVPALVERFTTSKSMCESKPPSRWAKSAPPPPQRYPIW